MTEDRRHQTWSEVRILAGRRQKRTNDINVNLVLSHAKDLLYGDVSTSPANDEDRVQGNPRQAIPLYA